MGEIFLPAAETVDCFGGRPILDEVNSGEVGISETFSFSRRSKLGLTSLSVFVLCFLSVFFSVLFSMFLSFLGFFLADVGDRNRRLFLFNGWKLKGSESNSSVVFIVLH